MRYPVAIEPDTKSTAFGIVVPDLPGCFSAGDTMDEAIANAEEAASAWIDATLDSGQDIPEPSSISDLYKDPDYKGWSFGFINIDPALLSDRVKRVNITLPERVLERLDLLAKNAGETRSGMIASLTLKAQKQTDHHSAVMI
ncbi:type II toxin-antitoxin system HicB family antitoxin [Zymomonas mobilis]|uniref:HicB-like antitoxin of toxin-antitoxin system domain-containing protein n=1 Tax=Zymomonas mobilis subsp. mobilis (strain ATCC 31821 / ZM4 / CP4) TaxID=264203 RepID=A0A806DAG2_ZYMMO|nr:type II toxin-antitoxin system HicB family antitoxin [Zymomonas mobilis]ADC33929.1 protein of unknown function UPF0150 [Zymomonas mobilis subsp. mobilis ZM4 = ATCC 31821]AHB11135.1 hypothetical protein ZCP4_1883 [Zymomonas mobilis subsp. mobilis str. CP4 = NRRL B-14023]AHJ71403.1 putative protein family (UPF0150) [Zymomonas mobilis subsp. mobilis NRRL B-12526]AHJ73257.1 putative protein family (UPF0150) [Zymomonas mobilis subsp. mobilis str. CP4 = NRRL B-14023]